MHKVVFLKQAVRDLKKMDKYTQAMIFSWIAKNLDGSEDPRLKGKALTGSLRGHWRYRVGDYGRSTVYRTVC